MTLQAPRGSTTDRLGPALPGRLQVSGTRMLLRLLPVLVSLPQAPPPCSSTFSLGGPSGLPGPQNRACVTMPTGPASPRRPDPVRPSPPLPTQLSAWPAPHPRKAASGLGVAGDGGEEGGGGGGQEDTGCACGPRMRETTSTVPGG